MQCFVKTSKGKYMFTKFKYLLNVYVYMEFIEKFSKKGFLFNVPGHCVNNALQENLSVEFVNTKCKVNTVRYLWPVNTAV